MTKRVNLGIKDLRINETECEMLLYILRQGREQRGLGSDSVTLSRRSLSAALGCVTQTTLRACSGLAEKDLISIGTQYTADKGQAANAYSLTALGIEVVRIYEEVKRSNSDIEPA